MFPICNYSGTKLGKDYKQSRKNINVIYFSLQYERKGINFPAGSDRLEKI